MEELSLLVDAGFTPMQALQAATSKPAEFFGAKDWGTIGPGRIADLVLLEANPLEDIGNSRKISAVIVGRKFSIALRSINFWRERARTFVRRN